jgi:PAS domain S-box-containing protein
MKPGRAGSAASAPSVGETAGIDPGTAELLAGIVESSDDAIVASNPDGVVIGWNRGAELLYGYRADEVIGRSLRALVPDDRQGEMDELFARIRKGERIPHRDTTRRRKDGTPIAVSQTASPIFDRAGELVGISTIARDISERRQAEEELRAASQHARSLIEASLDLLVTISPAGKVTDVNQATIRATGAARESLIGSDFCDYFTEPERARDGYQQVFSRGLLTDYPLTIRHRSGRHTDVLYNASLYRDARGQVLGVFAIARDVTAQKLAEVERARLVASQQEVARSERAALHSLREKEVLLREIHHRVKNNLQVISSLLSMQARYLPDAEARAIFAQSQNRVQSIALVHEQLYRSADLSHVHFEGYVQSLIENLFYTYGAAERGIACEIDVGGVQLSVDQAIPCGLLINELVTNALKHGFPSGRRGLIRVLLCADRSGTLHLTVADDGVGIPRDFDLHDTRSLGLDLIFTFAEQLDAVIEVEREAGTAFVLRFPGGA